MVGRERDVLMAIMILIDFNQKTEPERGEIVST